MKTKVEKAKPSVKVHRKITYRLMSHQQCPSGRRGDLVLKYDGFIYNTLATGDFTVKHLLAYNPNTLAYYRRIV